MASDDEKTDLFEARQRTLFAFAMKHRRVCTAAEWRLLRHVFELEHAPVAEEPLSMAADGETLNAILAGENARTWVACFRSEDGSCRLTVTLRPQTDAAPIVHLKMAHDDGSPAAGVRVVFPGIDREIATDGRGRAKLAYADYLDCLRRVLALKMVAPDGTTHALEMD